MLKRFAQASGPGAYLRIVPRASSARATRSRSLDRPAHGVTIALVARRDPARRALLAHAARRPQLPGDLADGCCERAAEPPGRRDPAGAAEQALDRAAGPLDRAGEHGDLADGVAQALGRAVGAELVGLGEQDEQLLVAPDGEHVGLAQGGLRTAGRPPATLAAGSSTRTTEKTRP